MDDAVNARERLGLKTRIEWKYILFEWNDSDEEMREAYELAQALGIELGFSLTPYWGKSQRFNLESLDAKINELMPEALNTPSGGVTE